MHSQVGGVAPAAAELQTRCLNAIRILSADMVETAVREGARPEQVSHLLHSQVLGQAPRGLRKGQVSDGGKLDPAPSNQESVETSQGAESQLDGCTTQLIPPEPSEVGPEIIARETRPIRRCLMLVHVASGEILQRLTIVALGVRGGPPVRGEMRKELLNAPVRRHRFGCSGIGHEGYIHPFEGDSTSRRTWRLRRRG